MATWFDVISKISVDRSLFLSEPAGSGRRKLYPSIRVSNKENNADSCTRETPTFTIKLISNLNHEKAAVFTGWFGGGNTFASNIVPIMHIFSKTFLLHK